MALIVEFENSEQAVYIASPQHPMANTQPAFSTVEHDAIGYGINPLASLGQL